MLVLYLIAFAAAGCHHVAPYDRELLAHPTMTLGDDESIGEAHVHAVQEGATGGRLEAQGGCGCD
jgi:hypothetical protein